jgi:cytochrome c
MFLDRVMSRIMNHICHTTLVLLLVLLVALTGLACDSRSREIKSRLSPEEAALYDRGRQLSTECWTCHDLYEKNIKVGPYLVGVFGREAGSVPDFAYSEGFRRSRIVWDRQSISAYLSNVPGFIPGTNMVSRSVTNPVELRALVFYLEHATRP